MTLREISVLLGGTVLIALCGCATAGGPGPARGAAGVAPSDKLTVTLSDEGIVDEKFRRPDRPPILRNNGELLLLDVSEDYDFDVTFILEISEPRMQQGLGGSDLEGNALVTMYEESMKSQGYDFDCPEPPRCEVTYQTSGEGAVTVPYAPLDLGGAKIVSLYVFTIDRRSPGGLYRDAPRARGFVGLETKFIPELEVPLDNTGIADWGFLNPRSPNYLPGAPTAMQEVSTRSGSKELSTELAALRNAMAPPGSAERIQAWADAVAGELEAIRKTRIVDPAVDRTKDILAKRANPEGQPPPDRSQCALPEEVADQFVTPQAKALAQAIWLVCDSAVWTMEQMVAKGMPESTGALELAEATLRAVSAARSIMTTALQSNYIDPAFSGKIGERFAKIEEIWRAASAPIEAILQDPAITPSAKQALSSLAARQSGEDLAEQVTESEKDVNLVKSEIARFAERQRIVRFSNRTLDRTFIVSFTVSKDKLLEGIAPREQKKEEAAKDEQTLKLETIEGYYSEGFDLEANDGNVTVSFRVDPGSYFDADAWLLSKAAKDIIPFEADFFDQTDDPAQSRGYIARKKINPQDKAAQPDNSFVTNLVIGLTGKYEPCFGGPDTCPGTVSSTLPYEGDRKEHYEGRGQLDLFQSLGNWANGKVSLLYKSTDFGKTEATTTVSQYQANIFGTNNTTLTLGKFTFASPSHKIAALVSGEGVRFTFHSLWLSYLIKRESDSEVSNDPNKDHDLWMVQWNQPIRRSQFFRKLELLFLKGEDQCKPRDGLTGGGRCTGDTAFRQEYITYGGELFFTVPFGRTPADPRERRRPLTGSLAGYHSERDSRGVDPIIVGAAAQGQRDGKGTVALFTLGRPFGFVEEKEGSQKVKPLKVLSSQIGYGTGDDPGNSRDEGFLGNTTGFSPDQVFLSTIANKLGDEVPLARVGKGLSNKWYYGLQYTDNRKSLLGLLSALVQANADDIVSESTTISVHGYLMHKQVFDDRDLGHEIDLEFRLEQPKNVKWRLTGGYFFPGDALRDIVKKEVLSVTAGVVIEPAKLAF